MMFSEFQESTKCRDTAYNHKVFHDLEILYMNSDITKAEIYEYGKKLIDNRKTEEEIALEKEINEDIKRYKEQIRELRENVRHYKALYMAEEDRESRNVWKMRMNRYRDEIKLVRRRIENLKWVIGK